MRSAKEWLGMCPDDEDMEGNLNYAPDEDYIKRIQLDAYKAGMLRTAHKCSSWVDQQLIEKLAYELTEVPND